MKKKCNKKPTKPTTKKKRKGNFWNRHWIANQ